MNGPIRVVHSNKELIYLAVAILCAYASRGWDVRLTYFEALAVIENGG